MSALTCEGILVKKYVYMQLKKSLLMLLVGVWGHIDMPRRVQFFMLLLMMIVAAIAEVVSIGAVLPFLAALTTPEKLFNDPLVQPIINYFSFEDPYELQFPLTVIFAVITIVAGVVRLLLVWVNTKLSFAAGADLSLSIYKKTLYQPYQVHVNRNSSEIINGISVKTNMIIYSVIVPMLTLISSGVILLIIISGLLFIDPVMALSVFLGFGCIYFFIAKLTGKKLQEGSETIARKSNYMIKALQEGLGGIRDVLIDGTQGVYCDIYRAADLPLRRAQGINQFISHSPRYLMEVIGMLLIIFLAYVATQRAGGISNAIPIIGTLVLGAQRMLPVMQQGYWSWANIKGAQGSFQDALALLDQPLPDYINKAQNTPIPFERAIELKNISFRYGPQSPWVLRNLNLTIPKSSRLGFIGTTGSGKSTLVDIVMGLLLPSEGALTIDGKVVTQENQRTWQTHIAHVPQAIFLSDTTISENIAFGVPLNKIDHARVLRAAQKAQLAESIESWEYQYNTIVGERGVKLSGGQRQRIGIARALYKNADVIIFDEATSALDNETEQAVMDAIESLGEDLTILIIAHRLTTLKKCTQIIELGDTGIKSIGGYSQLIEDRLINNS